MSHDLQLLQQALNAGQALSPEQTRLLLARLERAIELDSDFEKAVEQSKLQALRDFAYGASHEINNPLANISTRAQALLGQESNPENRRKLAAIVAQAMRAHEMISDLMLFAKPPKPAFQLFSVQDWMRTLQQPWESRGQEQNTAIVWSIPKAPVRLQADANQLAVALLALLRNALESLTSGGEINVAWFEGGESVVGNNPECGWQVVDHGAGISPEQRPHIFNPFYSGREAGRGLGFGLCKAWRIAEQHGGRIVVQSEPHIQTTFSLCLPLSLLQPND